MKKITLLMTALLWSSLFYGQTYVDEGFEGAFPPAGWADQAGPGEGSAGNLLRRAQGARPEEEAVNV